MALVRAIAIMAGGLLAGLYLDLWRKVLPEGDFVYRLNFLFSAPLAIIAFTFHYLTYRAWKRLGGDTHYVPPDISLKISTLAPRSDGTTHVRWGLASITVWAVMGALLSNVVWIVYYTRYEPNPHHALIWIISLVTTAALYLVYLWFLKFMERR
jgi:MFS family permease